MGASMHPGCNITEANYFKSGVAFAVVGEMRVCKTPPGESIV